MSTWQGMSQAAKDSIVSDIYEDILQDLAMDPVFTVHRIQKLAKSICQLCGQKCRHYALGHGRDIYGNDASQLAGEKYDCPSCRRPYPPAKFAMHLEKCLGLGRTGMRAAARSANAAISNDGRSVSEAETESDSDSKKKKKSGSKKSGSRPSSVQPPKKNGKAVYGPLDTYLTPMQPAPPAGKPIIKIKLSNRPANPSPLQQSSSSVPSEAMTPSSNNDMSEDWDMGNAETEEDDLGDEDTDDGSAFASFSQQNRRNSFAGKTVPGQRQDAVDSWVSLGDDDMESNQFSFFPSVT
ncbi:hypothetical protein DFJ74DRAFT_663309 [Hyaloraphidium curvatum]|nr:hypothetical protein DFJ74DRAFT_663309 [Hyaloraphidium curvatum]